MSDLMKIKKYIEQKCYLENMNKFLDFLIVNNYEFNVENNPKEDLIISIKKDLIGIITIKKGKRIIYEIIDDNGNKCMIQEAQSYSEQYGNYFQRILSNKDIFLFCSKLEEKLSILDKLQGGNTARKYMFNPLKSEKLKKDILYIIRRMDIVGSSPILLDIDNDVIFISKENGLFEKVGMLEDYDLDLIMTKIDSLCTLVS